MELHSRRAVIVTGLTAPVIGARSAIATNWLPGVVQSNEQLTYNARREGRLRLYGHRREFDGVLEGFQKLYPFIAVESEAMSSTAIYDRFLREIVAGQPSADLIVSSAMDAQIKLVNDGHAQTYVSAEKPYLPSWVVWKDQAYGVTAEPVAFVYNRKLLPDARAPRSHDEFTALLRRDRSGLKGKIATYDVARSATGFLFYSQDLQISRDTLALAAALGRAKPRLYLGSQDALDDLQSGRYAFFYNMVSSYALERQADDPRIGIIYPDDYTLIMSRIAFVSKYAKHSASAKLFLNYLLSRSGQSIMATRHMAPVRLDIPFGGAVIERDVARSIHFGSSLIANLDQFRRRRVLEGWREAMSNS